MAPADEGAADGTRAATTRQGVTAGGAPVNGAGATDRSGDGCVAADREADGAAGMDRSGNGCVAADREADGAAGMDRPGHGVAATDRSGHGAAGMDRPGHGAAATDRPVDGTAATDRPVDGAAGMDRPVDGAAGMDRLVDGAAGMDRPADGAAGRGRRGDGHQTTGDAGTDRPGPGDSGRAGAGGALGRWGRTARRFVAPAANHAGGWSALRHVVAWALVAPVALWLVVRLTGAGRGTRVETLIVFTPYVALASLVVVGVVAVLRVRPALLAAVLCCAGFVPVLAPRAVPGPHPSPAPDGPALRVMTSNVQYGWADAAEVVRLVRDRGVDVLGVQELTPDFHDRLLAEGLGDELRHMVVDARPGAQGTGLYSRYPVDPLELGVDGVSAHPAGVVDVPGAAPVQVTVVHPMPPVSGGGVAEWRRTFATLPRPTDDGRVHLLIGDFNATVDQPTMRDLLDDGYVDAADARGRGWVPTWRARRFGPGLTIDHVLVDRSTGVEGVSVHDVAGSDHRAVVAELRLPAG